MLASGLALDLLDRGDLQEACDILDEAVTGHPFAQSGVVDELTRLSRKAAPALRSRLLEVLGYLRARVLPAEFRLASAPVGGTPSEDPLPLAGMDREEARSVAEAMLVPRSPAALYARYAIANGLPDPVSHRRLFAALEGCVQLGAAAAMLDSGIDPRGATVVEIGGGPTLHGLALRCLGAERYVGVLGVENQELRTYRNPFNGDRWRAAMTLAELAALVPGLSFVADSGGLEDGTADGVLLHPPANGLDDALAEAARLLRPGGTLSLFWRNRRSWSGHGRAPQTIAAIDTTDPAHAALVDWQHLGGVRRSVPTLAELETCLGTSFAAPRITRKLDDPGVILRLSNRLLRSHPRLIAGDFVYHSVHMIATRTAA